MFSACNCPLWNKILSVKDKKIQEQERRRITTHFIPLLPQLLVKVNSSFSAISNTDIPYWHTQVKVKEQFNDLIKSLVMSCASHAAIAFLTFQLKAEGAYQSIFVRLSLLNPSWPAVLSRHSEGEPPPQSPPLLWPGDVPEHSADGEGQYALLPKY